MVLHFLPMVDNCCFSISLKVGSVLIAFYCMIIIACHQTANNVDEAGCNKADKHTGVIKEIMKILHKMRYATSIFLALATIMLLIGLIMRWPAFLTIFVITAFIFVLVEFCVSLIIVVSAIISFESCKITGVLSALLAFLLPLLLLYFVIVVNSYEEVMP